jgi:hypothetical protein
LGGIPAAGRIEARAWGLIAQRRYRNATGPAPPPPTLIRFMTRVPARAVPAIMDEGRKAWINKDKENTESAEVSGFQRQARAILSTFSPTFPPSSSTGGAGA